MRLHEIDQKESSRTNYISYIILNTIISNQFPQLFLLLFSYTKWWISLNAKIHQNLKMEINGHYSIFTFYTLSMRKWRRYRSIELTYVTFNKFGTKFFAQTYPLRFLDWSTSVDCHPTVSRCWRMVGPSTSFVWNSVQHVLIWAYFWKKINAKFWVKRMQNAAILLWAVKHAKIKNLYSVMVLVLKWN